MTKKPEQLSRKYEKLSLTTKTTTLHISEMLTKLDATQLEKMAHAIAEAVNVSTTKPMDMQIEPSLEQLLQDSADNQTAAAAATATAPETTAAVASGVPGGTQLAPGDPIGDGSAKNEASGY